MRQQQLGKLCHAWSLAGAPRKSTATWESYTGSGGVAAGGLQSASLLTASLGGNLSKTPHGEGTMRVVPILQTGMVDEKGHDWPGVIQTRSVRI